MNRKEEGKIILRYLDYKYHSYREALSDAIAFYHDENPDGKNVYFNNKINTFKREYTKKIDFLQELIEKVLKEYKLDDECCSHYNTHLINVLSSKEDPVLLWEKKE